MKIKENITYVKTWVKDGWHYVEVGDKKYIEVDAFMKTLDRLQNILTGKKY